MNKTLIIYGTRRGTTKETVIIISEILQTKFSQIVDIADSKQIRSFKKRINEYDNIIIGSSIMSGFWKSSVLSFAKKDIFKGKKVAVFVTAGGTLNKVAKYGITKDEAINEAIYKYIDKKKFKFIPVSKIAFGGKKEKRGNVIYNSWNKEDIENWTFEFGKMLTMEISNPG